MHIYKIQLLNIINWEIMSKVAKRIIITLVCILGLCSLILLNHQNGKIKLDDDQHIELVKHHGHILAYDKQKHLHLRDVIVIKKQNRYYFNQNGYLYEVVLHHRWYSQLNQGAPQGCEGTALQIVASCVNRNLNLHQIYQHIGYSWHTNPNEEFYGDPFAKGTNKKSETVCATPMTNKLKHRLPQIQDLTGANTQKIIQEIQAGYGVVTWGNYHWKLTGHHHNMYHVMAIVGYKPGKFLISDPYAYHKREYWLSMKRWSKVNQKMQGKGWKTPQRMNLTIH
ncbi:MAG: C39 family peptidase [Firmicutes bacterium]|uniref:C39 family peptidase n=1 Tax=Candidatus Gallilactobacillus intestinavium TaxID=2840838 RepID=A0A9D9E5H3_9LACO|nr:C39 family peptidase [Candidatus Gallilactobacillus intestinavium]